MAPSTVSGFDSDDDGWTVAGDAQRHSQTPDFNGVGGNPGGLITARDDAIGGIFFFVAPTKYHGDRSASYGQWLKFDLMTTSVRRPFKAYGVMLSGPTRTIVTMLERDPSPAKQWHSYAIALDPRGRWKVVSNSKVSPKGDFSAAQDATEEDIRAVLGSLDTLKIRGEFNTGDDRGSLDNVKFGDPFQ